MNADVYFSQHKHIGLITLTRSKALNALNLSMIKALYQQLLLWQDDKSIQAVILQAEPGRAFCAGGDVRWLYETGLAHDPQQMEFFKHEYRLNYFINQFNKPYIALMDGITMGGGVGISLHGSHAVASENFIFAMPETAIGLFPDVGASYLLAKCPHNLGMYLALTGNRLTAQEAYQANLVDYVIKSENFAQVLPRLSALDLAKNAQQQVAKCLSELAMPAKEKSLTVDFEHIERFFSCNNLMSLVKQLKDSDNAWALAILNQLQQKSPTSLAVTFKQIQQAKNMNLAECLNMDYCLVKHFMSGHDFYEGVRAALIDKDKNPRWQPDSLAKLRDAQVDGYFKNTEKSHYLELV